MESQFENRRAALELDDIALQASAWAVLVDALALGVPTMVPEGRERDGGEHAGLFKPSGTGLRPMAATYVVSFDSWCSSSPCLSRSG